MPRGSTVDGVPLAQRVADAALQLLRGADDALPCSRVAISTTDFEELAPPPNTKSIMQFFAVGAARGQGGVDAAASAVVAAPDVAAPPVPDADNALHNVDVEEQARILADIARRNKRSRSGQPTITDALFGRAPKR